MPLNVFQTPPIEGVARQEEAVDVMVDQVASILGGEGYPDERALALRFLDRASDRLNAAGIMMFRTKQAVYDGLTSGQTSLELPSDWAFPYGQPVCRNSDDEIVHIMEWKPWDLFEPLRLRLSGDDGAPKFLSIRNDVEGPIFLYPYVDTDDVAKIEISYHARINRLSAVTDAFFVITPEAQEALIAGGIFFAAQHRYLAKPQIWVPLKKDFEDMINDARAAGNRYFSTMQQSAIPDLDGYLQTQTSNFNFTTSGTFNVGPVYIRI